MYVFDRYDCTFTKKFWRCQYKSSCKARIHTRLNEEVIKRINEHSHEPEPARIAANSLTHDLRNRTFQNIIPPINQFNEILQNVPAVVRAALPNRETFRRRLQRANASINQSPSNPGSLEELILPLIYTQYESEPGIFENFLIWDSGRNDPNRILVFGRSSISQWISLVTHLFVDGTFSLAPHLFSQVFVILGERSQSVIPLFYPLLPNKTQQYDCRLFSILNEKFPSFLPSSISCDFEKAVMNAITLNFPSASIFGCLFHLTKNFKKTLSNNNLILRYNSDAEFQQRSRFILGLAFVPIEDLTSALISLRAFIEPDLNPIINWFEDTYVGRPNIDGTRASAMFPPNMWSMYQRTLQREDRTNNYAEAAHKRLQIQFGTYHPTIWKFIEGLKIAQKNTDQIYIEFIRGDNVPAKRTKYQRLDERIRRIVASYSDRAILEYLSGIANNLA